jgi:tetratricopeptide (TPR) repeat protein
MQQNILVQQAFEQAAELHAQGRLGEAEELYGRVLKADAQHFDCVYRLGLIRLQQGRFDEAERQFRKAIEIDENSADALHHLAISLTGQGRADESLEYYQKALALNPDYIQAHNNRGHVLHSLDRHDEAVISFEQALAIDPTYAEARNNLGNALQALGRYEEAANEYQRALAIRPNYLEARSNLASALTALERYDDAISQCEEVLAVRPQFTAAHVNYGLVLEALGRDAAAAQHYRQAVVSDPTSVVALYRLGHIMQRLGHNEEAARRFEEVLRINPHHVEALNDLGEALRTLGELGEAVKSFEKSIALNPNDVNLYLNLAYSKNTLTHDDPYLVSLEWLARDPAALMPEQQAIIHFALGKMYADLKDYERSFEHLQHANTLHRNEVDYDERATFDFWNRLSAVFSADLLRAKRGIGNPSYVPIFIVGLPRSGTTLVEQILASHPKVFGGGEMGLLGPIATNIKDPGGAEFPESVASVPDARWREFGAGYLRAARAMAPNAERIIDKSADNFKYLGLIALALPNARLVHVLRDSRDVAVSCYSILFAPGHEYSYDLAELGRYIAAYHKFMKHWRQVLPPGMMIEVKYETLVRNVEQEARRITSHCGLAWDDRCLEFHKTRRPVRTASAAQVRQPIYQSSIGRWKSYDGHLSTLFEALNGA